MAASVIQHFGIFNLQYIRYLLSQFEPLSTTNHHLQKHAFPSTEFVVLVGKHVTPRPINIRGYTYKSSGRVQTPPEETEANTRRSSHNLSGMIHKLVLTRRPFGTIVPLTSYIRSLKNERNFRLNQQSFSSNKLHTRLIVQPKNLQAIVSISNRRYSNKFENRLPRYSSRFLEFNNSISSRNDDFTMSHSEWENLESEILTEVPSLASGLDYSIMKTLNEKPDLSVSFFNYIKSKREPNSSVLIEFFLNCAEKYEDTVLNEFEKFKETNDLNRSFMNTNRIARSIAKTKEWKQSIAFLDLEFKANSELPRAGIHACAQILKASLKYQDYKTFFQVWTKLLDVKNKIFQEILCQAFYESWKEGVVPVDVLFELLKLTELPLQHNQMRELLGYCNSTWGQSAFAVHTDVEKKSRRCVDCKEIIPKCETIDIPLFENMCKEILQTLLIGENVFRKTSPKELEDFSVFMRNQKHPFDYAIDGSNLIYKDRSKTFLYTTLKDLSSKGKHVLVTFKGKQRELEETCRKWATVLCLDSRTYDDCYLLLAAFLSGPKCYIVTNDDLKDHIAAVDPTLQPYFRLWRDQQRVFHNGVRLIHPPTYRWIAHESENAWHIPCRKNGGVKENPKSSYAFIDFQKRSFMCVWKKNYVPSPELALFKQCKTDWVDKTNTEIS